MNAEETFLQFVDSFGALPLAVCAFLAGALMLYLGYLGYRKVRDGLELFRYGSNDF